MGGSHGFDAIIAEGDGVSASLTRHEAMQRVRRHDHRAGCVHVVVSGIYVELGPGRAQLALPGDVVWKPPGDDHANLFGPTGAHSIRIEAPAEHLRWGGASRLLRSRGLEFVARVDQLELEDVLDLARSIARSDEGIGALGDPETAAARELWRQSEGAPRIAAIAEGEGVERTVLARRFRRRFDCSMRAFLNWARVARFASRVVRGGDTLADAALLSGFADQSHATRAFRSALGLPPARWARQVAALAS